MGPSCPIRSPAYLCSILPSNFPLAQSHSAWGVARTLPSGLSTQVEAPRPTGKLATSGSAGSKSRLVDFQVDVSSTKMLETPPQPYTSVLPSGVKNSRLPRKVDI